MGPIVNATPHPIRFQAASGEVYEVAPSGTVLNVQPVETPAGTHASGAEFVRVSFIACS